MGGNGGLLFCPVSFPIAPSSRDARNAPFVASSTLKRPDFRGCTWRPGWSGSSHAGLVDVTGSPNSFISVGSAPRHVTRDLSEMGGDFSLTSGWKSRRTSVAGADVQRKRTTLRCVLSPKPQGVDRPDLSSSPKHEASQTKKPTGFRESLEPPELVGWTKTPRSIGGHP